MNLFVNITIGVVSGVVASVMLFLVVEFGRKIILPWYQQVVYKGIDISREWYSYVTPFPQDIKLDIVQTASQVTGMATYINPKKNGSGIELIRTFRVKGQISDRFLQLTLSHTDKGRIGTISYLLEVVGDGRKMKGSASFYDLEDCKISHDSIAFCREMKGSKE